MATVPATSSPARFTDSDDIALALVEAVAAAEDTDPVDLEIQLSDHVDCDGLAAMYRQAEQSQETTWTMEFSIKEHVVTVDSDGSITVSYTGCQNHS